MVMDLGLVPIAAAVAALVVAVLSLSRSKSKLQKPPQPPGWLHVGLYDKLTSPKRDNLPLSKAFTMIGQMVPGGARLYRMNLLAVQAVCVSEPDLIKDVLVTQNPPKSQVYSLLGPLLGTGSMVIAHGDLWSRSRRAFNAAFSWAGLKAKLPLIYMQARRSTAHLRAAASTGEIVSMLDHVMHLTQQVIVQSLVGPDLDLLSTNGRHPFFDAFYRLVKYCHWVLVNPQYIGLLTYTPLGTWFTSRDQARMRAVLVPWVQECMRLAKLDPDTTPAEEQGLLPGGSQRILVSALRAAEQQGQPMSVEFSVRQVLGLVFAGHDTTASTCSWALLEISRRPEIEHRVMLELKEVMGDGWVLGLEDRAPTSEELGQLKYMNVVIKEALRLYPAVPVPSRYAPAGTQLGDYDIGSSAVVVNLYAMQRDPAIWGEDAEEFRPERWLDEAYVAKLHPLAWSPFSRGPRDCIGQQFALLEMRVLLAEMLRHFKFTYAGAQPEEVVSVMLDKPKFGVPMRVTLRK